MNKRVAVLVALVGACKTDSEHSAPAIAHTVVAPESAAVDAGASAAPRVQKRGPANVCVALKAPRDDDTLWFERTRASAPTTDPCKTLAAKHRAFIAPMLAPLKDAGEQAASMVDGALDALRCVAWDGGAWATAFDTLSPSKDAVGLTGKLSMGYYDAAGSRRATMVLGQVDEAALSTATNNFVLESFSETTWLSTLKVFDWDGDGQPEVFVRVLKKFHEGGSPHRGFLLTSKGAAITEYEPAAGIRPAAVFDADGDGRPDVFSPEPFAVTYTTRGMGNTDLAEGPLLMAHSLDDGTFSFDDDVAKDAARCWCPASPVPFVPPRDFDRAVTFVTCARIWGAEAAKIVGGIATTCEQRADADDGSSCMYRSTLEELAEKTPRVHLP